jgi:hypothetical protein
MSNENEKDPIKASVEYLVMCGWSEDQAKNLIKAIKSEKSGEHLWEIAPKWIDHCGESMKYVHAMLGTVAMGLVTVTEGEDGKWMFKLNDEGMGVGAQLKEQS